MFCVGDGLVRAVKYERGGEELDVSKGMEIGLKRWWESDFLSSLMLVERRKGMVSGYMGCLFLVWLNLNGFHESRTHEC